MESITIILPLPSRYLHPNVAVATPGGRFAKAACVKKWKRLTQEAIEHENLETIPWTYIVVYARFFFRINRRRDDDNAKASLKCVYDGIVQGRLVVDDQPKYMKKNDPEFFIDRENPRLELYIERIN